MQDLKFELLDPIKQPLLKRFYKQHYPSTKPKSDELTIVAYDGYDIKAVVRFRTIANYRLLTGMAVSESNRGQGIGLQLLGYCQEKILQKNDFCFSYAHLQNFYEQAQFKIVDTDELPGELKSLFIRYSQSGKNLIPMQFLPNEAKNNQLS